MSSDSHTNNNNRENNAVVTYRRNAHFGSAVQYTSSIFVNIQQLQTDLQTQYQHEKAALNELNQRFYLFVERVQSLESQNAKYLSEIVALRRRPSDDSGIDAQWNERYFHVRSDLATLRNTRLDHESDIEWYQLQMGIYQQLMNSDQQWKDKRFAKLEQELKQMANELATLRTSYTELERIAASQYAERDHVFNQYLTLTHDWCNAKKQRKKWDISLDTLKSYIAFYKSIRSYSTRYESTVTESEDSTQYWALELDRSVQRIRHDFEAFYGTIYREMTAYYERKVEQANKEVEQAFHYQRLEMEEFSHSQQSLHVEYEKIQHTLTYERETHVKLEAMYSKLEADLRSLEVHYEEQFEAQSFESTSVQENILSMVYDVDEIQRSKVNLEAEIIVYRYLLDSSQGGGGRGGGGGGGGGGQIIISPQKQTYGSEMSGKLIAKAKKKRSIGIKECAVDGKYITLMNHSSSKDIDLSRWMLKRRIDSSPEIRYIIPDGVRLQRGKVVRIYSKLGSETSNQSAVSASVQHQLVNHDIVSWGVGNNIETILFNPSGEEEASYLQSVEFKKAYM